MLLTLLWRDRMQTTITIIRHAPTEYNKKSIFMGTKDIPVNSFDEKDIQIIRDNEYIKQASFLYSSPLLRALGTAKTIANNQKSVITDTRLIERCLGDWQGVSKKILYERYPDAFINGKMDFYYTPQNGEPYDTMVKRISDFIIEKYRLENNLVIVTHNGVFRVMKSLLTGEVLSNVFSEFEPYLSPQTFCVSDELLDTIISNPLYTVDK